MTRRNQAAEPLEIGVEADPASDGRDYLGPATVRRVSGGRVHVELARGDGVEREGRMALAFPYRPVVGDSLLVIARGDALYVIGVLEGSGETALTFRGGVEVRAEGGALRLVSDRVVSIEAADVAVQATRLRIAAESAVEKVGSLVQHVRTLFSLRAKQSEAVIEEGTITRAKTATILTEETMNINGKQIHLG